MNANNNLNHYVTLLLNNSKSKEKEWSKNKLDNLKTIVNNKHEQNIFSADDKKKINKKINDNLKLVNMKDRNNVTLINCSVINPSINCILSIIDAITSGNSVLINFGIPGDSIEHPNQKFLEEIAGQVSKFFKVIFII